MANLVDPSGNEISNSGPPESAELTEAINRFSSFLARTGTGDPFEIYEGDRDLADVFGYKESPTISDLFGLWERDPIAGAIVSLPPEDTWQKRPIIKEEQEDGSVKQGGTKFEEQIKKLEREFALFNKLEKLDKLTGIGEYGAMMMGLKDVSTDKDLSKPPEDLDSIEDLAFLKIFSQKHAEIQEIERDKTSPNLGKPILYRFDLGSPSNIIAEDNVKDRNRVITTSPGIKDKSNNRNDITIAGVHHGRVIHVAENTFKSEHQGRPRLQRAMDRIHDLMKEVGSAAESFFQIASPRYHVKQDPDFDISSSAASDMKSDWKKFANDITRYFRSKGVDVEVLGGEDVDPSSVFDATLSYLCAEPGVPPKRILVGSETGERSSTEDRRMWFSRIGRRRRQFAEPKILRPTIDRLQKIGVLEDAKYRVIWPQLVELTEEEKSEIMRNKAKALKDAAPMGNTARIMDESEIREKIFNLPPEKPNAEQVEETRSQETQERQNAIKSLVDSA